MDNHQIHNAMLHLDPQLIEEAAQPTARKTHRLRKTLLAACLCLVIMIPVMAAAGNLLVEHYFGDEIPNYLDSQELDAFFHVSTPEKLPVSSLSQQVLDAAAAQEDSCSYHGFDTWDDAEAFLGLQILDCDQMQTPYPVDMLDAGGKSVLHAPAHLTLYKQDGLLSGIALHYYFQNQDETLISLTANAVTDQSPQENNASFGISNDRSHALKQTSENYQTASGIASTIVATQYSDGHGWVIDGWTQRNHFILHFSVSADQEEAGMQMIRDLLDSIR